MAYQFLRGTTAQNDAYTGPEGSFTVDLEKGQIRLHDGVTQGGMATITNLASIQTMLGNYAKVGNNLSDLISPSAARTNLGLGTSATQQDTRYSHRANNLSDLGDASAARSNLGLGTAAVFNDGRYLRQDTTGSIAGSLGIQSKLDILADSNTHLWFKSTDGSEQALVYHNPSSSSLRLRVRNGEASNKAELTLNDNGDITASTGRFTGSGSGLTNLSSGEVGLANAGLSAGVVGTYGFMKNLSGSATNPGNTISGSNLQFANNLAGSSATAVSGTWRCMGYAAPDQATLYLRIS